MTESRIADISTPVVAQQSLDTSRSKRTEESKSSQSLDSDAAIISSTQGKPNTKELNEVIAYTRTSSPKSVSQTSSGEAPQPLQQSTSNSAKKPGSDGVGSEVAKGSTPPSAGNKAGKTSGTPSSPSGPNKLPTSEGNETSNNPLLKNLDTQPKVKSGATNGSTGGNAGQPGNEGNNDDLSGGEKSVQKGTDVKGQPGIDGESNKKGNLKDGINLPKDAATGPRSQPGAALTSAVSSDLPPAPEPSPTPYPNTGGGSGGGGGSDVKIGGPKTPAGGGGQAQ